MNRDITILIIDTPEYASLLERAVRENGIANPIQVVNDGQEGIDYLCATGKYSDRNLYPFPSIIFSEVRLPRVSGFEVLKWLRAHPECSVIPVIILSISDLEKDIKQTYVLGGNSHIVKPKTLEELQQIIRLIQQYWAICAKPEAPEKC